MITRMVISLRKAAASESRHLIEIAEIPCFYGTSADTEGSYPPHQVDDIRLVALEH